MKLKQTLEKLGQRIKEIREQKGMSQKSLARNIGEDVFYIQQLELGLIDPDVADLGVIIHELDMPISEFFNVFES